MTCPSEGTDPRRAELAAALTDVRDRIERAVQAAGRDPGSVALLAVTKTWPADDVRRLAELGVDAVGENRDQEARAKRELTADLGLRWHLVGGLQRNKARSVLRWADVVESVDRLPLVESLSREAQRAGRELEVLVQVNLDDHTDAGDDDRLRGRSGIDPDGAARLADAVEAAPGLLLRGVMAVAPLGGDADAAFARLEAVSAVVRADHPQADQVSAGMTDDLEQAVRHGSTSVRVGRALLGVRPRPVG